MATVSEWSANELENLFLDGMTLSDERGRRAAKIMAAVKAKADELDGRIDAVDARVDWNWHKTLKTSSVQFVPVPESDLEPVVDFVFTETLPAEGEKGPENPSTITGVTQAKVTRCGNNLIPFPYEGQSGTVSGVEFIVNNDGTVLANGTASANIIFRFNSYFRIKGGVPYCLSGCPTTTAHTYSVNIDLRTEYSGGGYLRTIYNIGPGVTFTEPNDCYCSIYMNIQLGISVSNLIFKPQLEPGIIATSFEPYTGNNYTIQLGDTYYGGSLDTATGVMTVTHMAVTPDDSTVDISSNPAALPLDYADTFGRTITSADGTSLSVGSTGGTVVYKLATPNTVQLTPTQIKSLPALDKYEPRINTVYTDQEAVHVGYQRYVDTLVTAAGTTASRTLPERFADVVNVKDFGARGDGTSDDTAAVQAAMTAAGTTGTVVFPQGTYCVTTVTAECSLLGVGVQASIIKGTGTSGNVVTWTGPERRTLSRLKIIAPDGCNGIQSNQRSWVTIHDAHIRLLGAGHGIDITIASSTTRALVATNFSISAANPGYETVGIYFSRATDIRLSNFEIMGCQVGIKVENTGSTLMLITNGHIWCGDLTKNQTQWFNGTRCIWCRGQAIVCASNFYADTCNTVFYCENAGSKIYVKNFMYWDDESYNNACNNCHIVQRSQTDNGCTFDIQGGLINCTGKMLNVFGDYAITYNFTEVLLPSGFTFSASDSRLPRVTHYGNKSYTLSLVGTGYTPIAYVRNTGDGYLRFTLSDTTGGQRGAVEVLGSYVVNYYSNVTTSKLYYEYDSVLGMVTLYLYHDADDIVSIAVETSTRYHDIYLHNYIYEGSSNVRFTPTTLDNADTLTLVSATSY